MSSVAASGDDHLDEVQLRRDAASVGHPLARLLLALTFTAGMVDAASYLGLGRVFTANITGNLVLLGFGIAHSGGLPVLAPAISLGAFLLGAGTGGLLGAQFGDRHIAHVSVALTLQAGLIACATILAAATQVHSGSASVDAIIAALAGAMGVQTATARR